MKCNEKSTLRTVLLIAASLISSLMLLTSCGTAETNLTASGDGSYSFTASGSDSYVIQMFGEDDYEGEELVSGAEYALTQSIDATSGEVTGQFENMDTIAYGNYLVVLYSMDSNFEKTMLDSCTIVYGGQLSTPEVSYSCQGFQVTATLSTASYDQYNTFERVTDCIIEVYDDPDCTDEPLATATIPASGMSVETVDSGFGTSYTYYGNSVDLTLDGTLGQDSTYYFRAKMEDSEDGIASASEYTEVEAYTTNGAYASRSEVAVPDGASQSTVAATYEITDFSYQLSVESFFGTETQDASMDCLVELQEDGSYAIYTRDSETSDYVLSEQGAAVIEQELLIYFTAEDGTTSVGYFADNSSQLTLMPNAETPAATLIRVN